MHINSHMFTYVRFLIILEMSDIKCFMEIFLIDTGDNVMQLISSQRRCFTSCFTSIQRLIVHQCNAALCVWHQTETSGEAICKDPDSFPFNSLAFGDTFGAICILIMWKQQQDFRLDWQTILDLCQRCQGSN